ncbi:hypothetical protein OUZ56_023150 [Daphnia magna]|uniref:Secreted protein n=1 Tax=Daphnia magna TaxID=35525 RepID=A0ABR0AYI2_9CRUS|nr:hypothetical protein OUZ56_023150 [Daphnia magna]
MRIIVALSALVLAVCIVTSQCKPTGNTNINQNSNANSNFDFLSSFLSSVLIQQRKAKAIASRAKVESPAAVSIAQPTAEAQQDVKQTADESQAPAEDTVVDVASTDESAPRSEPQEDAPQDDDQFMFIQSRMAQDF